MLNSLQDLYDVTKKAPIQRRGESSWRISLSSAPILASPPYELLDFPSVRRVPSATSKGSPAQKADAVVGEGIGFPREPKASL